MIVSFILMELYLGSRGQQLELTFSYANNLRPIYKITVVFGFAGSDCNSTVLTWPNCSPMQGFYFSQIRCYIKSEGFNWEHMPLISWMWSHSGETYWMERDWERKHKLNLMGTCFTSAVGLPTVPLSKHLPPDSAIDGTPNLLTPTWPRFSGLSWAKYLISLRVI